MLFDKHCDILTEAGVRALGAVVSKFKHNENMLYDTYTKCIDSSVNPVVDYGAEVWGLIKESGTDRVQLKAIRAFLGVHKFAPGLGLLGDIGWMPSHLRRKLCLLRFWNKLVTLPDDRITKHVFNEEYRMNGKWCSAVKALFVEFDCLDIYENKLECDLLWCKDKLMETYCTQWKESVTRKPKLRTYCKIKKEFGTEEYVRLNLTRQQRSLLAQLRLGILPLALETGRFTNVKVENRICTLCNVNKVETEVHFLLSCKHYQQQRSDLFNSINTAGFSYSLADNFIKLCNDYPRKLSKYIVTIWERRKTSLYR